MSIKRSDGCIGNLRRNVRNKTDGLEFNSLSELASYLHKVTNVKVELIHRRLIQRRKHVLGHDITYLVGK